MYWIILIYANWLNILLIIFITYNNTSWNIYENNVFAEHHIYPSRLSDFNNILTLHDLINGLPFNYSPNYIVCMIILHHMVYVTVRRTLYTVHCTRYRVRCTLYTVYNIYCTPCILYNCTMYTGYINIHFICTLCSVHCTLCSAHCTLCSVHYTLCSVHTISMTTFRFNEA